MTPSEKASGLIARATHENTPIEEARTCGVLLARLIVKYRLELRGPADSTPKTNPLAGRWIRSKFAQWCRGCSGKVLIGQRVLWTKGSGIVCEDCAERGSA